MKFIKTLAGGTAATICGGTIFALGSIKSKIDSEGGRDTALQVVNPILKETKEELENQKRENKILMEEDKEKETTMEKESIRNRARIREFMGKMKEVGGETRKCRDRFVGVSGGLSRRNFNSCSNESDKKAEQIFKEYNE